MLGIFSTAQAQTLVGEVPEFRKPKIIPGYFSITGHPYIMDYNRDEQKYSIYQSDFFTPVREIDASNLDLPGENYFYDLDLSLSFSVFHKSTDYLPFVFTQNLFNDDAHFEYFEYADRVNTVYYDTVYWYDEELDSTICEVQAWEYSYPTTLNVKSTNGSTLWSYHNTNGVQLECVIKFDNKVYFFLWCFDPDPQEDVALMYLIDRSQGITKVESDSPLKAFPTLLTRDEDITVELEEGTFVREITVVNSLGQEVKRIPIENDQRTVIIPANGLSHGLNILNARGNRGHSSCKVIVK